MQTQMWQGNAQILDTNGTCWDEGTARLEGRIGQDGQAYWHGEVRSPICPTSKPWPANRAVTLGFADGQELQAWLEPVVYDDGPILVQVARLETDVLEMSPVFGAFTRQSATAVPA